MSMQIKDKDFRDAYKKIMSSTTQVPKVDLTKKETPPPVKVENVIPKEEPKKEEPKAK